MVIHPGKQFAVAQDCMWWLSVLPFSAGSSALEIGGCFPSDVVGSADFDARAVPCHRRWEQVDREHVSVLKGQQRALGSVFYRSGAVCGREDQVQTIGLWVLSRLGMQAADRP